MAKNLLLEYSEELARKCELLCKSISGNANTANTKKEADADSKPAAVWKIKSEQVLLCSVLLRAQLRYGST